jgi:hypothetical protein
MESTGNAHFPDAGDRRKFLLDIDLLAMPGPEPDQRSPFDRIR